MIIWIISLLCLAGVGFLIPTGKIKAWKEAQASGRKNKDYYEDEIKTAKFVRLLIVAGFGVIIVISLLVGSIRIIDQTEVGVVRTFGKVTSTLDSGIHLVNPFTDSVTKYDTKVQSLQLTFPSYSKDQQTIDIVTEVQFQLTRDVVMQAVTEYGTYDALKAKLPKIVEEKIKVVIANLTADQIFENRGNLSPSATIEVRALEENYPITFTVVRIVDIAFSEAYKAAVEAKMKASQEALRAEQEKKIAITNAERDKETAIIQAEQKKQSASINAETAKIQAEGEATAKVIAAQGQSDAMKVQQAAYENAPAAWLTVKYLEKWNGVLPKIVGSSDSPLILPSDILTAE